MNKLKSLQLVEVTSQTQANNGTVCYHDPIANCDYLSYESGYVRRKYSTRGWRSGHIINTIYQLNRKKLVPYAYTHAGKTYNSEKIERVLEMDPEKRLDAICQAVVNYRKHLNK
jgi:hypothetical protein